MICRMDFNMFFFNFEFLSRREDFAWAIAFASWGIIKMPLFLEYFVLFKAGYRLCTMADFKNALIS